MHLTIYRKIFISYITNTENTVLILCFEYEQSKRLVKKYRRFFIIYPIPTLLATSPKPAVMKYYL